MKIVYSKHIPFKGFFAINLFGVMVVRKTPLGQKPYVSRRTINHESIHTAQMKELWYVGFYLLYFFEWVVRLFINGPKKAYKNISFEREAYANECNWSYLAFREPFAWTKHIKQNGNS